MTDMESAIVLSFLIRVVGKLEKGENKYKIDMSTKKWKEKALENKIENEFDKEIENKIENKKVTVTAAQFSLFTFNKPKLEKEYALYNKNFIPYFYFFDDELPILKDLEVAYPGKAHIFHTPSGLLYETFEQKNSQVTKDKYCTPISKL